MAGLARRCLVLAVFSCCSLAAALALVVFGNGATWERELPVCASERSACSLIHRRYWQSPLEIRLCRCPRKEPCPEGFETATNASAFNVTARTQLKMCSGWQAPPCNASQVSLVTKTIGKIARVAQGQNGEQTHAEATCRCTGQGSGVHYRRAHGNNSADLTYYEQRQYFTCETALWLQALRHKPAAGHVTQALWLQALRHKPAAGHVTQALWLQALRHKPAAGHVTQVLWLQALRHKHAAGHVTQVIDS
ncbi:uncharacterized protein LOC119176390 isoform X2 [Rhipicephalus microplus]|uniref:uncharacterized protein LOC119176390 isoform X2 n=1 Tax=Rhipicephalus microplus TaxID=6941 RepID=UPI003F6B26FC